MALNGTGASADPRASVLSRSADQKPEPRALALVPDTAPDEPPGPYASRPAAPFLAHLIATARGEPQTCDRRRTEPKTAAQAYAAAAARVTGT